MKVGIDARIVHYNRSGIGRYARGLIPALTKAACGADLTILQSWRDTIRLAQGTRVKRQGVLTPPHFIWEEILFPLEIKRFKFDLVHAMDFFSHVPTGVPMIATVHDLYFLHDPSVLDAASRRHYAKVLRVLPEAAHIVCDSESTRTDLLHFLPDCANKSSVAYPGIDPDLAEASNGAERNHILFVGTVEPRKNLVRMIEAYSILAKTQRGSIPPFFIAGRKGSDSSKVEEAIRKYGLESQIRLLGEVDEAKLADLYGSAHFLLFASLYEGFGFPILEAMRAGTPVITSRNSSTAEIAGDAALLVDPKSSEEIAQAMTRLLTDQELCKTIVARGQQRCEMFTWDKTARTISQVYEQVCR